MQKDYIHSQIKTLWSKYDSEGLDMLDKIETANFLTEILSSHGLSSPGLDKINKFFRNYDNTKDGMIHRSEMANFIKKFVMD
jgi:Ca2+-binding EF-hand superfamily protein